MTAGLHRAQRGASHIGRRFRAEAAVRLAAVAGDLVEEFCFRRAGADQEHIDLVGDEFRTQRIAESMQREFARAVF